MGKLEIKDNTYSVLGFEREAQVDSLPSFLVLFQRHQGACFSEMTFAPRSFELDDGVCVYESTQIVTSFEESCRTVGEDCGELFPHDLVHLPRRALNGDVCGHRIPLDGFLVLFRFEESLSEAPLVGPRAKRRARTFPSSLVLLIAPDSF